MTIPSRVTSRPGTDRGWATRHSLALVAATGILLGLGAFTFRYGEGLSYFSSDPAACVNCHIMQPQYSSWQKASHHTSAVCVDCHLPVSLIPKLLAKASNGWHHSKGFTLQDFHEPIMIKPGNSRILQENCLRCHGDMVHAMAPGMALEPDAVSCVHCHASVGHGETTGLGGPERNDFSERMIP
ncbi:MAG: cytochrome c nitrite reductase small subunit [Calditrichaeota bacterium]|nr:cytochrome c nitrite reductase small subunit [Candidatus Cloacimonadota bacterium]MCA9785355.1 cytochrome c nitrite reductase small subunit [Candidatus Cloacimonadota bacterium]MCB1045695.1 cytochrome c nitrite reductase small subunit [Calditrichota bacterium]MCB9473608.1 cytochrome c nitrite reductase small subunit [Candidatus Delongbacteria bacterium]